MWLRRLTREGKGIAVRTRARLRFLVAIVAIIGIFISCIGYLATSIKQGLDLQGGTHIVLEAKDSNLGEVNKENMDKVVQILGLRINEMGLTEPLIQREGERRIIIELPGIKDPDAAIKTIGKTAVLEFKDQEGRTVLTGNELKDAKEAKTPSGNGGQINIEFTDEGAKKFADLTTASVGKKIAITLDGKVLTDPVVNEPITGGRAVITGPSSSGAPEMTLDEARETALLLRSGALPLQIEVMEMRTVGPSLGQDSKDKSIMAFGIGIALIVVFLICLYRFSGFVATMALLIYVMITLLALGPYMLNATLTLPGIAGIILSMGVAVDANILIFERFKEEVFWGKSLRVSMEAGFKRAFTTILDANTSVMITSAILIIMGSGPVKGFAITLALGVLISMFTAITMSRLLLRWLMACDFTDRPFFFGANVSPAKTMADFAPVKKGGKK